MSIVSDIEDSSAQKSSPIRRTMMDRVRPDRRLLALIMVYITVFIDFIGVAILIPVQPFLVGIRPHKDAFTSDEMGGLEPGAANSLIMASFMFAQFISTLAFGPLSDRIGRRPMLLVSLIGGAIGFSLQGVAIAAGDFLSLVAARVFTGLVGGTRPVAVAYIADSSPPDQRPKLMGMLALSVTFAMQFGPLLGGSLGMISLPLPCYVAAGISLVGLGLAWSWVPESPKEGKSTHGHAKSENLGGDRIAFGLNIAFSFCSGFWFMSSIFSHALLMPLKFGYDPNQVGLAALGDGLMILIGNPIYLTLIKKISVPLVAFLGCMLMTLITAAPFFSAALPVFVFRYLSVVGGPMALPAVAAIVSIIAPPHRRGAWTGLTLAAQSLGRAVAPASLGVLFDVDYRIPFCISGGVALLGALLCLCIAPRVPKAQKRDADHELNDSAGISPEGQSRSRSQTEESLELTKQCEILLRGLRERREIIEMRKNTLQEGQPDPLYQMASEEERAQATVDLSEWLVRLLDSNGYTNWPANLEGVKLMLFNSFPPIRTESQVDKLTDIIAVLDRHIGMAEKSQFFEGGEDLFRTLF